MHAVSAVAEIQSAHTLMVQSQAVLAAGAELAKTHL